MRFFRTGGLNRIRYEEEVSEKSDSMRLPMNAKRKTSAMLALLMALGVTNVVRGDDFETIRRFPKPTPLPASTTRVGTDKDVAHNALHHKFSDMVGKPDRKGSIHFNGHPAEIAALTLDKLGLMNGYPDGTFRPDRTITRAEFAAVVSRAFKFAGSSAAAAFSDPDGPLMETEAVKMVVVALGYADDAAAKGGYPRGYMRVGNEKYISRGLNVHIGEQATRGLAAQIMFYALGSQMLSTLLEDVQADRDLLNQLIARLYEMDPDADALLEQWQKHDHISDRAIARMLNCPQRTFADRIKRIRTELRRMREC